jgi:hypothetical protein
MYQIDIAMTKIAFHTFVDDFMCMAIIIRRLGEGFACRGSAVMLSTLVQALRRFLPRAADLAGNVTATVRIVRRGLYFV